MPLKFGKQMKDMHYFAYFKQKKTLKNQTLKELANLAPKN